MLSHLTERITGIIWTLPSSSPLHRLRSPLLGSLAALSLYLSLVRFLRFQRVRKLERRYGKVPRKSKEGNTNVCATMGRPDVKLTPEEAQKIMFVSSKFDMPGLMDFSLVFALFKTFAIPSISVILAKSQQLGSPRNVSKRYTDTSILIGTWLSCPFVDSSRMDFKEGGVDPRGAIAVARVNWLHSRWPMIKNDDFLYTMALFVLEPPRWAKAYGWRELLPIEQEAYFVYWKEIGKRMNIKDIPETLQELYEWTKNYEEVNMVLAASNYEVGMNTLNHLVRTITEKFGFRDFMRKIIISLLQDRVRKAFMFSEPSPFIYRCAGLIPSYFAICHRYFSLPRITPYMYVQVDVPADELKKDLPRQHPSQFGKEPWYKPEPSGLSWVVQAVLLKVGILEKEFIPGAKYRSHGYRLEEIGPIALENSGHAEVMNMAGEIQGCPVTGVWARGPN